MTYLGPKYYVMVEVKELEGDKVVSRATCAAESLNINDLKDAAKTAIYLSSLTSSRRT